MARKEIITDDLDGKPDAEPVTFSLQGVNYEIDLTRENLEKLDGVLAPFIDVAREVKLRPGKQVPTVAAAIQGRKNDSRKDLDEVREWAGKNGYEVSSRGRVAKTILDAYDAANRGTR